MKSIWKFKSIPVIFMFNWSDQNRSCCVKLKFIVSEINALQLYLLYTYTNKYTYYNVIKY